MKKLLISIFLIVGLVFATTASAQFDPRRLTIGGGLGLQFGDYTLINLSPQIGYNVSNYFNVGAGFNYSYYKEKTSYDRIKQSYLGFNLYTRFYPIPLIVLMIQPEVNRMWQTIENRETGAKASTSKMVPSCVVGGGLRLGSMTVMLKYDLGQNINSPYGTRLFYSIGYTFGF